MIPARSFVHFYCLMVFCLFMLMLSPREAKGQPAGANWQRVQQLPVHTRIHVTTDKRSRICVVDRVDEETLACSASRMVQTSHYTFAKGEIKRIKLTRYAASTALGAGIGAGIAIVSFEAINSDGFFRQGELIGVGAAVGGLPGGIVGLTTDFARGPLVYQRP